MWLMGKALMMLLEGVMGIKNLARAGVLIGVGLVGILGSCDGKREVAEVQQVENRVSENVVERDDKIRSSSYFSDSELEIINYTAKRIGVDSAYLMAIRKTENGREGLEFGIIPTDRYREDMGIVENGKLRVYENEFEKQASWSAWTIKKNLERFKNSDFNGDFIGFLQRRYCPIGAENDPDGLNENWEKNVRFYYNKFKED